MAGIENAMIDPESVLKAREVLLVPNDREKRPGPESIVCVLTTTSCFSPRVPDRWVKCSNCVILMQNQLK